jgi:hypothetical protein
MILTYKIIKLSKIVSHKLLLQINTLFREITGHQKNNKMEEYLTTKSTCVLEGFYKNAMRQHHIQVDNTRVKGKVCSVLHAPS